MKYHCGFCYTHFTYIENFCMSCFREYDAALLLVLPHILQLPPRQLSASVEGYCAGQCMELIFPQGAKINFAYPHMHYLGKSTCCTLLNIFMFGINLYK